MEMKENAKELIGKLTKIKWKPIILAGLVYAGSTSLPKAVAETRTSDDPEITFHSLVNKNELASESFFPAPMTKLEDVKDDAQVWARADEIYAMLEELGYTHEALPIAGEYVFLEKQHIFNLIKLIGAQNPFDRPVEHEDIFFNVNLVDVIMNKEGVDTGRAMEGISAPEMNLVGHIFPYSYFVQDDHKGKKIIQAIEFLRHGMIKNPTKDGAYPYAMKLAELIYKVYLTDGYGDYPSYYQAETSGERFLGTSIAIQTIAIAESLGKHIGYQNYANIDGKDTYCFISIEDMKEELNNPNCPTTVVNPDGTTQEVMMSTYSETIMGMYNEANDLIQNQSLILK